MRLLQSGLKALQFEVPHILQRLPDFYGRHIALAHMEQVVWADHARVCIG